jgi:hypothetical protein
MKRYAAPSAAVVVGHDTKVDLNAVPRGEAVAAPYVCTDGEAESLVVLHRRIEVMDGKIGAMHSMASASQRPVCAAIGIRRSASQTSDRTRGGSPPETGQASTEYSAIARGLSCLPACGIPCASGLAAAPGLFPPSAATTRLINLRRFTAGRTL